MRYYFIAWVSFFFLIGFKTNAQNTMKKPFKIGQKIDSLKGVYVYYNGSREHVKGRNLSIDGYNLGLEYQCVEFVKRYYYEELNHKMPNTYGHARDFFNLQLKDGALNEARALTQFINGGSARPKPDDLLVYQATDENPYGHVAIVVKVDSNQVEIIQQNRLVESSAREIFELKEENGNWLIENPEIVGWLRKE